MTLQDLGNIGELVSAIAVVVSLLYLAAQIRQNTRTVRTSSYQAALESTQRVNEAFTNPRSQHVYQKGRRGLKHLEEEELPEFRNVVAQIFGLYEALFLQRAQGAIDDDFFAGRFNSFHHMVRQPGVRAVWEENGRRYFARSFVERVDKMLASLPPGKPAA